MTKVSRGDKSIVALLLAVLAVLAVVAVVRQPGPLRSAVGQATTRPSGRVPGTSASVSTAAPAASGAPASAPPAGPVTAVGDSIMLDIQSDLEAVVPGTEVDGLVSRQFETGVGVVEADRQAGRLGKVLVVELGTNGSVTSSDFDAMMQAASGVGRVVFVNVNVPRSWAAGDNAVLAAGVARYPGLAVLADWNALSTPHPEWFTPDQVHLQPAGAQALAGLIAQYA